MKDETMIRESNQIAEYFEIYNEQRAREAVTGHLRSFWEPRMRRQLVAYVQADGEGLHPLVVHAAKTMAAEDDVSPETP